MLLKHPQVPCSHPKSTLLINYTFNCLGDEHAWNAWYCPTWCPTSCVVICPRLNGSIVLPSKDKYRTTTPSSFGTLLYVTGKVEYLRRPVYSLEKLWQDRIINKVGGSMYLLGGMGVQVGCTTFPKFCIHFGLLHPVISRGEISKVKWGKGKTKCLQPSIHEPILVNTCKHKLQPHGFIVSIQDIYLVIQLPLAASHTSVSLFYSTNNRSGDAWSWTMQGSYSWLLVLHGTRCLLEHLQRFWIPWGSGRSCQYWMGACLFGNGFWTTGNTGIFAEVKVPGP